MTPAMKAFQQVGRGMRSNPCGEIILKGTMLNSLAFPHYGLVNKNKPLQKRVWKNVNGVKIPLGKFTRDHAQAALQWCSQRKNLRGLKDGYTYQEWEAMFFAILMDPNVK